MLKVLVIDDERNIRENLETLINWEELGYAICGEADNGDDGLRKYNKLKPDLVLVDIRMPGMDGLEMIQAMKRGNEKVKILIITGYSYFNYARQAIDYGVDGYLLKPVDEDELREKVAAIKREIEKEKEEKELVEKSRGTVFEQFLLSMIKGEVTEEKEIKRWFDKSSLPWKLYQLFFITGEKPSLLTKSQKKIMKKIIADTLTTRMPGYILEVDGNIAGLYGKKITTSFLKQLKEMMEKLKSVVQHDSTLYVSMAAESLHELKDAYKHTKEVMSKNFFYRTDNIVFTSRVFDKKRRNDKDQVFTGSDLIEQLYMAVDLNEEKEIETILTALNTRILCAEEEEEGVKSRYMSLLYTIIKRIAETREDMYHLLSEYDKMIHTIGEVKCIDELFRIIKEKLIKISFELFVTRPRENVISRAIEYIKKYYNTNIKLKNLSEFFHYNSAYFGQLFKEETGHCFNTYIDMVRIDRAKEFLKAGMKVYKVAERTGFTDVDNFYKKFKKYSGMSPSEFKKTGSGR
ncbi:MAG: response regulator [Spirochaetales bacterium]|nr:response regulator [Spirochaetales bacterium]